MRLSSTLFAVLFCGSVFAQVTTFPTNYSLAPYTGQWTEREASHLLRRTLFCPTYQQIQDATTNGLNTAVSNLLVTQPVPPPLTYDYREAVAAFGQPWHNVVYPATNSGDTEQARRRSLGAWLVRNMMEDTQTIQEKMMLFWHNLYSVTESFDARAHYQYFDLIYNHSLGNFKSFVKFMTINPNMLYFLNGNTNTGSNPNENYAREFLELYTVGKADLAGVGDYTHYTEDDVFAGAKIFSGFRIYGFRSSSVAVPYAQFDTARHEMSNKTLSARFNNAVIQEAGVQEFANYVDEVFASSQFGYFVCEEIYRYFVGTHISTLTKNTIIDGMRQTLVNNNFEIKPVMEQLLKSQHFYDVAIRGSLMKSPAEYLMSIYNGTDSKVNIDFDSDHDIWYDIYNRINSEGMNLLNPPSVAGYPAYYQEPGYGKQWVSAVYYQTRTAFIASHVTGNGFYSPNGRFKVDALRFLDGLSNPTNAVDVVNDMCLVFCPKEVSQADKDIIKDVLTDGLPDFEWTIESTDYYNDPTNPVVADPVANRIKATLAAVFDLYMFQTF